MEIKTHKIKEIFEFLPKSKLKAGEGLESGKFPFYTSSPELSKFINIAKYQGESLIFGTGGKASIHFENSQFSTSTDCIIIQRIDNKIIDTQYCYYYLKTNFQIIENGFHGAGLKHISKDYIKKIKIPIPYKDGNPDLLTQKRIAKVLSDAEKLIAKRKETIKLLDEFIKSTFLEMFGDPVRNEKGWETKTIEELVTKNKYAIKRGPFGGALKKEIFLEEGYLVYEQHHALNNDFSFARYFISEDKFQELKAFEVKPGDIIISCSGVYLGKLAVVPDNAKPGIINQALLKLSLDNDIITNTFFYYLFTQENFKRKFFGAQRGGGIPNFPPMSEFKKFKFIYPPLLLQQQFSEIVRKTEALKNQFKQSLQELHNLYGSLSQKAFKGEMDLSKVKIEDTEEPEQREEIMEKEPKQEDMKNLNLIEFIKEKFNDNKFTFEELKELIEKDDFDYEYEKIKQDIFQSIDDKKINQQFDEKTGSVKLSLKQ